MKKKSFKKALCATLVCIQLLVGGLVVYAYDGGDDYVGVSPSNICDPRPK